MMTYVALTQCRRDVWEIQWQIICWGLGSFGLLQAYWIVGSWHFRGMLSPSCLWIKEFLILEDDRGIFLQNVRDKWPCHSVLPESSISVLLEPQFCKLFCTMCFIPYWSTNSYMKPHVFDLHLSGHLHQHLQHAHIQDASVTVATKVEPRHIL
jgi:hypothetical protein